MIYNIMYTDCVILEKNKYELLIKENKELKEELEKINAHNDLLRQNQIQYLLSIETFKNENRELKEEINKLREDNHKLKEEISKIREENKILKEENKRIMEENKNLREENKKLREENKRIIEENKNLREENKKIIEENKNLREENKRIIEENKNLREENKKIIEENKNLKEENKQLKNRVYNLEKEVVVLNNTINKIIDKNYINKIIYACQDLNSLELLEKKFKSPLDNLMKNLRTDRNDDCHLILNTDDNNIVLCKEKIFYDNLISLTENRKKLLIKKIGSELLNEIITYLKEKPFDSILSLIPNYIDEVNEWFDE